VECNVSLIEGYGLSEGTLAQLETVPRQVYAKSLCRAYGTCLEACAQNALSLDVSKSNPDCGKERPSCDRKQIHSLPVLRRGVPGIFHLSCIAAWPSLVIPLEIQMDDSDSVLVKS
jgi:hypothetical protein